MKFLLRHVAAILVLAIPALAQVPAAGSQQKPPQHQPGTPASTDPAALDAAPALLEKPDPAKEAAVRHLMDITQTNKMGENIAAAITNQVRQVMSRAIKPDQLAQFMDAFSQKLNASAPASAVTDAVVPIYSSHFSTDDIQGLIKFYESPLGRKVVSAMPQVTQESETAGIQIDQKAAMTVLRGMEDQYPELKQMLPPEGGAPGGANQPPAGAGGAPNTPLAPNAPPTPNRAPAPNAPPTPQK
jgi:uncharacterized protein